MVSGTKYIGLGLSILLLVLTINPSEQAKTTIRRCVYEVLEVKRDATTDQIKRSYRRLSMKNHPDKDPSPEAEERFREIAAAYEILNNNEKRRVYDSHGFDGLEQLERHGGDEGEGMNPFDLFSQFFGGGGGGGRQGGSEKPKVKPTKLKLFATLEQLYFGSFLEAVYTRNVTCEKIDECTKPDADCIGPGLRSVTQRFGPAFVVQNQVEDATCVGARLGWLKNCRSCPNGNNQLAPIEVHIDIERGMKNGDMLEYEGKGEQRIGALPGDLYLQIDELPHHRFVRDGNDLRATMEITLLEALVGYTKPFQHISGKPIEITTTDITPDGTKKILKGQGMPIYDKTIHGASDDDLNFGNLILTMQVVYPKKLTDEQRDQLRKILKS